MRHPFLRTLAGSAATPTDPNFENVTLLLHGDGTNGGQNNTFVDGSTNNFTITRNGNTTQGTFSPYGDNWSNYFDGTGDYLGIASTTSLNLSSGDWTVECWWFPTSNTAQNPVMINYNAGTDGYAHARIATSVSPNAFYGLSSTNGTSWISTTGGGSWAVGNWYHLAYVRQGSTFTLFVNGVSVLSYSNASNLFASNGISEIGRTSSSVSNFAYVNGYISNVRVVKGSAVYTSAFTPPTGPLTAITNTSLLTCQSNRFRDASTNNFTITRNGDVSVQRFSPFSPTAAYAAGTIGGSGYFDGTGDYLTVADNAAFGFGTGDFTIEAWIYLPVVSGTRVIVSLRSSSSGIPASGNNFAVETGKLAFSNGAAWTSGNTTLIANTWYHVAVTRSSGSMQLWLNGTADRTAFTDTSDYAASRPCAIGAFGAAVFDGLFSGYIANLRIVKGSAVYTAAFTPPTAPLTAITNTSLLLNFTNAAILDNAMMAVPETVGNAQISTSVKKYGTGSLYFDGNGDRLTLPDNANFSFGTGDFTIEAWVNIDSTVNPARPDNLKTITVFSTGSSGSNDCSFAIYGNTTTPGIGLELYQASPAPGALTVAATVTPNTWVHIAFVRTGTTFYGFVNGTRYTMGTSSVAIASSVAPKIGAANTPNYTNQFKGYIDDLRITKGVARYTSNFTPPTAAFPDL